MRVPLSWLREHCDPGTSSGEIADVLNLTGTEVSRVDRVGVPSIEGFVVGKVLSAERHPNADRLTVCEVDDGSGAPRTIVCGAPNVAAGQTVAVARPGALMLDSEPLREAELRGVTSSGMILAEDEVGVGEDHDGTMVLADGVLPGAPLVEHLQIADEVLDLEISPNRPDCLGVYGVARELHAATQAPLAPDPAAEDAEPSGEGRAEDHVALELADPDICLRFVARVFEDVKIGPSPLWLKARLSAAGQRPISNVVDITNYVMLLTGQPLHAFDLDRVRGGRIVVRRAGEDERMTTLDGVGRKLDPSMAVVADAEGPSGIAGVMGGQVSEVSEGTTRVLLEAATWVGPNILRTSSRLGLRSEASARFEKQLHPEQALAAQRLASRLMVELCGARLVPGTLDAYPSPLEPRRVTLRLERMRSLLGVEVPGDEAAAILERLGFEVSSGDGSLEVVVPPWRDSDVQREVDLIEEVGRIHGLDKLPITLPARRRAVGRLTSAQQLRRRLEDALRDRGLHEVVAWSFTSPEAIQRLRLDEAPLLRLGNPLSADQSVMRPLLLPGLLDAARHNAAHGRPDLALFESAHIYRLGRALDVPMEGATGEPPARERHHLAGLLTQAAPVTWRSEARPADFYAARALVEALLGTARIEWSAEGEWRPSGRARSDDDLFPIHEREPVKWPFLHPGRSATVVVGDAAVGWVGELHPLVARAWDLEEGAAFELDADLLAELAPGPPAYADLTTYPAVLQDIAVVVADDLPAVSVREAVRTGGGELLRSAEVFDVYRGEQVGEGSKSLALRLEFRAADRTLTDEEVAERRSAIEAELTKLGGALRG